MTISDLQQKLTDQLKVKYEVDMEVRDKIFVNPQDVTDYYNNHMSDFNRKPMVNLQSIFVSFDKHSKQEAQSRADEARSRMMAGEDFDKVLRNIRMVLRSEKLNRVKWWMLWKMWFLI